MVVLLCTALVHCLRILVRAAHKDAKTLHKHEIGMHHRHACADLGDLAARPGETHHPYELAG